MTAILKHGDFVSATLRARMCSWGCYWAGPDCGRGVVPHHHPPRGRLGWTDDSFAVGVCGNHHDACHGIRVVIDGVRIEVISEEDQVRAVDATFSRFWREAPRAEREQVLREMNRRLELIVEASPW